HHIGFPIPDSADNLQSDGKSRGKFPVVVVQYLVSDSQALGHLMRLSYTALSQYAATLFHMSGVPIGNGEKLYFVSHLRKQSGRSSTFDIAVVGMCPYHHNF